MSDAVSIADVQAEGGEPQATRAVLLSEQALSSPGGTLKKDAAAVEIPADAEPVPVEDEPDAEKEVTLEAAPSRQVIRNRAASRLPKPRLKSVFDSPFGVTKLVDYDMATYGEDWSREEKRHFLFSALFHVAWFVAMMAFRGGVDLPPPRFWYHQLILQGALCVIFSSCGLAVVTSKLNVAYSRKICHTCLFFMPAILLKAWPYAIRKDDAWILPLWTCWLSFLPFYFFIKPVRRRLTISMICFRALDRPDDRPHTLEWLISQTVAGFAVLLGILIFFMNGERHGRSVLVAIPLFINGLGDGLAEPVGYRWGKHKYTTRALWFEGRFCHGAFTRSLEGSFCVFLSGVFSVGLFRLYYSDAQFAVAMSTIPIALTLAEAFSPHTWDTPFIFAVGGALLILIEKVLPSCPGHCPEVITFFGLGGGA